METRIRDWPEFSPTSAQLSSRRSFHQFGSSFVSSCLAVRLVSWMAIIPLVNGVTLIAIVVPNRLFSLREF